MAKVLVEGGNFNMGSNLPTALNREKPVHLVKLDGFYIGKTEVTQALFKELMGWNVSYFICDTCPVNNVSWVNVQLFIERLNKATGKVFHLPTEAQWEYAARGGQQSKNHLYSGSNNINEVAWYANNAENKSHPVALKKPNELGLYDMTGNLWEFCHDDMSRFFYKTSPLENPVFLKSDNVKQKSMKVIRGSGYEFNASESTITRRDGATNNVRLPDIGFRLVMDKG
jgi:formylglycine-generating enzyme required for sulfatase activity